MERKLTMQEVEQITLHAVDPVAGYPNRWSPQTRPGAVIIVKKDRIELWSKGELEHTWNI